MSLCYGRSEAVKRFIGGGFHPLYIKKVPEGIASHCGCYVKDGKITRDASVRVLRDNIVIHEGKLGSLQRFKDAVKEVAAGYECGMSIEKFNDIKEGDIFECFVMEQIILHFPWSAPKTGLTKEVCL